MRIRRLLSIDLIDKIRAELSRYIREDFLQNQPTPAHSNRTAPPFATSGGSNNTTPTPHACRQSRSHVARLGINSCEVKLRGVETFSKPARIGSGVPYHQDNAYFCQTPPDVLTVWIAIDPVTEANGAVYFLRGSHRRGTLPTKPSGVRGNSIGLSQIPSTPLAEQFCATLEPGDATIHHCEVIHHSAPNRTDQARLGLLLVYHGAHTQTDPQLMAAYQEALTATPPA